MNVNVSIYEVRPETAQLLLAQAQARNLSLDEYLQQLAKLQSLPRHADSRPAPSTAEWSRRFRAWAASHSTSTPLADDSRESIYAGRGE